MMTNYNNEIYVKIKNKGTSVVINGIGNITEKPLKIDEEYLGNFSVFKQLENCIKQNLIIACDKNGNEINYYFNESTKDEVSKNIKPTTINKKTYKEETKKNRLYKNFDLIDLEDD